MASCPALDVRFALTPDTPLLHDLLYAELDAFGPLAIQEHETGDGWRVFFRRGADRDAARRALEASLGSRLTGLHPLDVDDEDWARRSQAGLGAVRAGGLIVAPPWDPVTAADAGILIVIEPSMGFGTGHHATTRLCLELLQTVEVSGRRAIDVGTGSGVLAIAAAKLGAAGVVGVDNDPDALRNARENAAANGVTDVVALREADLSAIDLAPADVVLANLTGAALERFAPRLRALVAPGGRLIVSGFAPEELGAVADAIGVPVASEAREGEWCAGMFTILNHRVPNPRSSNP